MHGVHARCLLPDGSVQVRMIELHGATIERVRAPRPGDPALLPGLVIPGLVNAHTHLELSWMDLVPGGSGFVAWGASLFASRAAAPGDDERFAIAASAAKRLADLGVAAVSDICGEASTLPLLRDAGLSGVVQRELLGFAARVRDWQLARAPSLFDSHHDEVVALQQRPCPHAPYSTPDQLVRACLAPGPAPASIHLAEDADEHEFLVSGTGPFADFLDRLDVDWRWWQPPGVSAATWLQAMGGLGPGTLVVHAVHTGPHDWRALAASATSVCLCIRSNLHIGGQPPPVLGLVEAGILVCLGTDSLASSPDLDVLAEIPALSQVAPTIPISYWLLAATAHGADALGLSHLGRLRAGCAPGLLQLDIDDVHDLAHAAPTRRWLVRPRRVPETA